MASYIKVGKQWRAQIFKRGVRTSSTFGTKAEAQAWAAQTELDIISGKHQSGPDKTIGDILRRYAEEVSVTKRGARWEQIRIKLFLRDIKLCKVRVDEVTPQDMAHWRDRRLKQVSASSVLREWNLISSAFTIAVKEWRWLRENPLKEVRRPTPSPARDRLITDDEIDRIILASGYDHHAFPITVGARVCAAFLFAIETGLRAGEIVKLQWDDVELDRLFLRVKTSKTATGVRNVPLSGEAIRILNQVRDGPRSVFSLTSSQMDAMFRKIRDRAGVEGVHMHDSRHLAITRLAKKLDVLALARMVGHSDLRQLQTYFNESAEDIAKRL